MTVSEWIEAMRAEADESRGVFERMSWRFGILTTTCRLLMTHAIRVTTPTRPGAAACTSVYFAGFSVFAAARLALEISTNHVPPLWGHVWMSIARCLGLAVGSSFATMALWHRCRIGRPLAIAFAVVQLVTSPLGLGMLPDALIIAVLTP
jgi:hypothetical protein